MAHRHVTLLAQPNINFLVLIWLMVETTEFESQEVFNLSAKQSQDQSFFVSDLSVLSRKLPPSVIKLRKGKIETRK